MTTRQLSALLVAVVSCVVCHGGEELPVSEAKTIIQQRVDNGWNAGIAVGLINASKAESFGYGKLSAASDAKIDGDTIFEIGSITKTFTTLLFADMVSKREVKPDDPVAKYLPTGVTVPEKVRPIMLMHLAQHTSELPRLPDNMKPKDPLNPYADYTPELLYEFLKQYKMVHAPGEGYDYSNLGMGLLGHALALKSGMDLEALYETRIFKELQMKDTHITLPQTLQARLALGHNSAGAECPNWDFSALAGCGALRSTANDMLKYLGAQMGLYDNKLASPITESHLHRYKINDKLEIALGWHISHKDGLEIIWHNGGTGGYRSFVGFNPNTKMGVVVLSNSDTSVDDIAMHLLDPKSPLDPAFDKKRTQHKEASIDPEIFTPYVGSYELQPGLLLTITKKDGKLLAQLTGQNQFPIFAESATEFFYTIVDAQIKFVKNDAGKVTHLVLHQNGKDMQANKKE